MASVSLFLCASCSTSVGPRLEIQSREPTFGAAVGFEDDGLRPSNLPINHGLLANEIASAYQLYSQTSLQGGDVTDKVGIPICFREDY